jgi:large subunit ribosomal protein L2
MKTKMIKKTLLAKQRPLRHLTKANHKNSGRNNVGRLTVRHQGGGRKQLYRNID